jgi:hypothetical protein
MIFFRVFALLSACVFPLILAVASPDSTPPNENQVRRLTVSDDFLPPRDPKKCACLRATLGSRDRADPVDLGERRPHAGKETDETQPKVELSYLKEKDDGWSLAETANFRIYHKDNKKLVDQVAEALERSRTRAYRKWVGDVEDNWRPKCYVYLDDAKGELSKSLHGVRGYTRKGGIGLSVRRYVRVRSRDDGLIASVLPHEVTHAVMFGEFGDNEAPSWAHEGMAVMMQPRLDRDRFFDVLLRAYRKNGLFYVGKLLEIEDYPDDDVDVFYAESVSLVEYLTHLRRPKVFVTFMRDALKHGYDKALQDYYGIENVADLEKRWKAYTFGEGAMPPPGFVMQSWKEDVDRDRCRN